VVVVVAAVVRFMMEFCATRRCVYGFGFRSVHKRSLGEQRASLAYPYQKRDLP